MTKNLICSCNRYFLLRINLTEQNSMINELHTVKVEQSAQFYPVRYMYGNISSVEVLI